MNTACAKGSDRGHGFRIAASRLPERRSEMPGPRRNYPLRNHAPAGAGSKGSPPRATGGVMGRGTGRAVRTARFGAQFFAAVAALALTLAGCSSDSQPLLMQAQLRGPSIAFESIDGPPLPIF